MFNISSEPIESPVASQKLVNDSAGALATFEGWVRDRNDGHSVDSLEYECFQELAEKEGARIIEEAKAKFDIVEVACQHRVGHLKVGELAVWVGATAVHRADAFAACRYVIDEIKLRLPVWKKEHYVDGTASWVNCSAHEHHKQNKVLPATAEAPPAALTEKVYYSRQALLKQIGEKGQNLLKNSSVLVIGAGGTGCPALQYLAGAGVGKIGICDFDEIDASNLHRQPLYSTHDIGKRKAEAAASRIRASNPFIVVQSIAQKFDESIASRVVNDYDLVLDCTDNLEAKFSIADGCSTNGKTLLQASIHGFDGELLMYRKTDFGDDGQCYRCLWPSKEALQESGRDCISSCAEAGVIGIIPGFMGVLQAVEAIKILLNLDTPLKENVLLIDLLSLSINKIKTRKSAQCPACSTLSTGAQSTGPENLKEGKNSLATDAEPLSANVPNKASSDDDDNEFELHWSVLRTRSPRELVYVDLRKESEKGLDDIAAKKLKGRQIFDWPLETIDASTLKLDRNLTYLFMCQRGKRSGALVRKLRELGHRNVFSLSEGVESMAQNAPAAV